MRQKTQDLIEAFIKLYKVYPNKMTSAITNANNAIASTKAKPNIVIVKTSPLAAGFLPTAWINYEKIFPIPIPDPITPITARPAPITFAASISIIPPILN